MRYAIHIHHNYGPILASNVPLRSVFGIGCVNVIVFSPSGDVLASGSDDGKVRLWNPYTFKCLRTMSAHQSNVFAAEFLPFDEKHMASGGNDAELKYYNLETEEGVVYSHHTRKVLRMTVHPDHPHSFMSCSADGTIRMIDTRQQYEASKTGPIEVVQGREGEVVPQALGGGRGLMRGGTGGIPIASSLILNYKTRGESPQLYSVDFNPMNGQQFIVGSDCGDIRLFDLRQIRERSPCSYLNIFTHKIGNRDDMTGCVFSRDGQRIVGTALSDAIYTWDINTNYEKLHHMPLCISAHLGGRREYCDHAAHDYKSDPQMLANFASWKASRTSPTEQRHQHLFSDEEEEEEEDNDDDEDQEEESTGFQVMDITQDEEALRPESEEPSAMEETSDDHHNLETSEAAGQGDHGEQHGEEHEETEENHGDGSEHGEHEQHGGAQRPNLRDILGAVPILTDEEGTMTIDLQTFLRLAAAVSRERRPRRGAAETAEPAGTQSTESTESSQARSTRQPPARPERTQRQSPLGPLRATDSSSAESSQEPPSSSQENGSSSPGSKKSNSEAKEKPPFTLPDPFLRRFTGHASVQTIKGVNFWGPNSEFVVSGSDDANVFVWDRETGELLNVLEGHEEVVNCVVGHPRLPLLATSGIDDVIKLWQPIGPLPALPELTARLQTITGGNSNRRRIDRGIQCAQQ